MAAMNRKSRILIVDDHPAVREGLAWRMAGLPDMEICGEAADVEQALQQCSALRPDLAIVDLSLKRGDGLDLIKQIVNLGATKTVVHSAYDEALYAERALEAGALGYIHKEEASAKVIEAIRMVLAGQVYLAPTTWHARPNSTTNCWPALAASGSWKTIALSPGRRAPRPPASASPNRSTASPRQWAMA